MFSMNKISYYLALFESFVFICIIVATNVNCQSQNGQNIVDNNVIIITEEVSGNSIDSSFGYTVSLLKNYNNLSENGHSTGWVFVGAPKGEDGGVITYSEYRKEPGVVWRCSLGSPESESCQMLALQPVSYHHQQQCYTKYQCQYKENQTGGWFGGSMNAFTPDNNGHPGSYGSFVGCAPLAQRITLTNSDLVNGVCYWVQQGNLSEDNLQNLRGKKLVPLGDEDRRKQFYITTSEFVYQYHYGQAGFSSHLTKENNLLLGAPGVLEWSGSVIYYESSDVQPAKLKPEVYPSQIGRLDLVGYTVTSGKFDVGSETLFAVGAPRAKDLLGSVLILRKPTKPSNEFDGNSVLTVLLGDQLGAYFGSVLCVLNFDASDQASDDLLVGAPFYTADDKILVKGTSGDQGCVFIFRSPVLSGKKEKLCSSVPGSRFGSAITSLGDINNDELNDFAVGAPYENGGVGRVYIYHGSSEAYNSDSLPSQIIDPLDAYADLKGFKVYSFGSSLHGGIDIDNNWTPDLVIGSYASKSVFVYRTRPTISFMPQVTFIIDGNIATRFKRTDTKFHMDLCVRLRILPPKTVVPNLKVWNKFTVDNAHRRFTVSVEKVNAEATYGHITEFLYEVRNINNYCIRAEVTLNSNYNFKPVIPSNEQQIVTTFQVWYNETLGIPLERTTYSIRRSGRDRNTIKNPEVIVQGKGFKSFCSHCPVSKYSEVQSDSLSIENDDCRSDNNPECTSELKFSKDNSLSDDNDGIIQPDKNNQYFFIIGSSAFLNLKIDVVNEGETAYNPIIDIKAPNVEGTQFVETGDCKLAENEGDVHKILRCSIRLPLHRTIHVKKEIKIDMSSIFAQNKTQTFPISVAAYPADSDAVKQAVTKSFHVILMAQATVGLQGTVDIKQISGEEKHQETIFAQTFRGSISGHSSIGRVVMIFKIPVNTTKNGTSRQMISVVQPTGIKCDPITGVFSTLKLDGNRKFPSGNNTSTVTYPSTKQKRSTESVNLHCKHLKEWQCMEIHCETKLQANKTISVEFLMSINNKIARPLLKDKKELTITSKGIIYILEENEKEYQKDMFSTTTFSMLRIDDFPVWIAFVAGIGGLILLLLITFGLAKCGFFRRKTKEELQKLKRQTRLEYDALLGESVPMKNLREDDTHQREKETGDINVLLQHE